VQSNIVRFELSDGPLGVADLLADLRGRGVLIGGLGGNMMRAVTHYGIGADDIDRAVQVMREALAR
jgi:threonine aldolase